MEQKIKRKFFYLADSCIWTWSGRFSQYWTKYLLLAVNVLTLTPNISPKTIGDIFQINLNEND